MSGPARTARLGASEVAAGIHPDMPMDVYLGDPCPSPSLSASTLRRLLDSSPAHAHLYHPRYGARREESTRADLGTAAHAMLLGGEERIAFVEASDWRTKAAQATRDAMRAEGRIPVLHLLRHGLGEMVKAARETLAREGIDLGACRREHTAIWQEGETWCRARPDAIAPRDYVIDYKTADNANPWRWIRTMIAGGYHVQAAWYLRALHAIEGGDGRDFLFLVGEMEPPYACSLVGVGPGLRDLADQQVEWAMTRWRECVTAGEWPGYDARIHYAEAPTWLAYELAEKGIVQR